MTMKCQHCRLTEPTEAELDALVAERSKPENLPAWWGCAAGEARLERTSAADARHRKVRVKNEAPATASQG